MDPLEGKRTLIDRLNNAQSFLKPLFGVKKGLKFGIIDFSEIITEEYELQRLRDQKTVVLTIKSPSGRVREQSYPVTDGDLYDGQFVSGNLYLIANPDIHKPSREHKLNYLKSIYGGKMPPEPSQSERGYQTLMGIVANSGGLAYMKSIGLDVDIEFQHYQGGRNAKMLRGAEAVAESRTGQGSVPVEAQVAVTKFWEQADMVLRLAKQLYDVRGNNIISELAHLDFKQARAYILQHIGVDILNPPRTSYIGRMQTPPKSIS